MNTIWNWFQGKKTHIIAAIGILSLLGQGWDTGNFEWEKIWALLLIMTGKSAYDRHNK